MLSPTTSLFSCMLSGPSLLSPPSYGAETFLTVADLANLSKASPKSTRFHYQPEQLQQQKQQYPVLPSCTDADMQQLNCTADSSKMDCCLGVDFTRINRTICMLQTAGYYYEGLSWQDASILLEKTAVGTFLVRDSADPRFLFSLSVQTERGPTSVRMHYNEGQFRLDSEDCILNNMPLFDCVVQLVEYYVHLSQQPKGSYCVWLDGMGRRDLAICLTKPLYRNVLPLKHLCRLVLNSSGPNHGSSNHRLTSLPLHIETKLRHLCLPATVRGYLQEYPHPH